MRPPICEVCDERFDPGDGGELVRFTERAAGAEFAERSEQPGFVGHPPDDGWFCATHLASARQLSATHTLLTALAVLRSSRGGGAPGRDPRARTPQGEGVSVSGDAPTLGGQGDGVSVSGDTPTPGGRSGASSSRGAAFRAAVERRRATRVDHELGRRARVDSVRTRFRGAVEELLVALAMGEVEPVEERRSHRAPSPEWRDDATATELSIETIWETDDHRIRLLDEDMFWDGYGLDGARSGALVKGALVLAIDDTRLIASYDEHAFITSVSESGVRTPAASVAVDRLLDGLRSPT